MRAFYSDTFALPLPEQHRFPVAKYRLAIVTIHANTIREAVHSCRSVSAC